MQKTNTILTFDPEEFVYDLTSIELSGIIVGTSTFLLLCSEEIEIDLLKFFKTDFYRKFIEKEILEIIYEEPFSINQEKFLCSEASFEKLKELLIFLKELYNLY